MTGTYLAQKSIEMKLCVKKADEFAAGCRGVTLGTNT